MFGYVRIAPDGLSKEEQETYKAYYCGLCHRLKERYGQLERFSLSYDLTFLYLLLSSLYDPESETKSGHCLPHPFQAHRYISNELADYCVDMNLLLAYYKLADDENDEHSLLSAIGKAAYEKAFRRVKELYPGQCKIIEGCLSRTAELEKADCQSPDLLANQTAIMLGCIYQYRNDLWSGVLRQMGEGLGRFIYLMDAYEDLDEDKRKKRFNPLKKLAEQSNYEELISDSLNMFLGECTEAFELLPIVDNVNLIRNILYAGCRGRYEALQKRQAEGSQEKEEERV